MLLFLSFTCEKDKNDSTKARCSVCHKTIELSSSSSGCSALTDQAKGMNHISAVNKVSTFFKCKISKKSGPVPAKNNHVNSSLGNCRIRQRCGI